MLLSTVAPVSDVGSLGADGAVAVFSRACGTDCCCSFETSEGFCGVCPAFFAAAVLGSLAAVVVVVVFAEVSAGVSVVSGDGLFCSAADEADCWCRFSLLSESEPETVTLSVVSTVGCVRVVGMTIRGVRGALKSAATSAASESTVPGKFSAAWVLKSSGVLSDGFASSSILFRSSFCWF